VAGGNGNRTDPPTNGEPLSYDMRLVRTLDNTLRSRYPDGVSLITTLEGGQVLELHRRIHQAFNPHACAKAAELTQYLWSIGRTVTLEPGGGITIGGNRGTEKSILGRTFYRDVEAEYRILHCMIAEALRL
jgi:hypothetical protein